MSTDSLIFHDACGLPVELCVCVGTPITYDWERDTFVANGCSCSGVEVGSHAASIVVDVPEHMADYRESRMKAGLAGTIWVDSCALPEIRSLWAKGIRTYGSCCGHNAHPSMVNVHEDDAGKMEQMGYKVWPILFPTAWPHTYYLKSVGRPAPSGEGGKP